MPRVSEEHLERRRRQIIDAARACFIRKGLHETSMQDIFAESGLSAGAVYRYFKSKNEIVDEIVSTTRGDLLSVLSELVEAEPLLEPDEVCLAMCTHIRDLAEGNGPVRMALQAWALAAHDAPVGAHVRETMVGIRDLWTVYARRLAAAGRLSGDVDAEAAGRVLFGLFPGFILQYVLLGDATPEIFARGVRSLFPAAVPAARS
ncbi:TetR/AcrR family transcriptional regulator [Actinomadura rupiterrae]|uniref:TetR/AcrR family transcriptional regulator n=1 Tax=Actinomadura rupiterrae TaxID=559627 RepID=UPI0020A5D99A|nr:TetR/AcrR family transcriptional regulator [Actinomadura rupiterrae]MCP2338824.1 AcrR family transcriptional regulator [Actinomadura rupiterrae]